MAKRGSIVEELDSQFGELGMSKLKRCIHTLKEQNKTSCSDVKDAIEEMQLLRRKECKRLKDSMYHLEQKFQDDLQILQRSFQRETSRLQRELSTSVATAKQQFETRLESHFSSISEGIGGYLSPLAGGTQSSVQFDHRRHRRKTKHGADDSQLDRQTDTDTGIHPSFVTPTTTRHTARTKHPNSRLRHSASYHREKTSAHTHSALRPRMKSSTENRERIPLRSVFYHNIEVTPNGESDRWEDSSRERAARESVRTKLSPYSEKVRHASHLPHTQSPARAHKAEDIRARLNVGADRYRRFSDQRTNERGRNSDQVSHMKSSIRLLSNRLGDTLHSDSSDTFSMKDLEGSSLNYNRSPSPLIQSRMSTQKQVFASQASSGSPFRPKRVGSSPNVDRTFQNLTHHLYTRSPFKSQATPIRPATSPVRIKITPSNENNLFGRKSRFSRLYSDDDTEMLARKSDRFPSKPLAIQRKSSPTHIFLRKPESPRASRASGFVTVTGTRGRQLRISPRTNERLRRLNESLFGSSAETPRKSRMASHIPKLSRRLQSHARSVLRDSSSDEF
eukprot:313271_1